ncbi:SelB C-terminal domain-containing protein, partial [Thermodesulfobacteriota bacterium]
VPARINLLQEKTLNPGESTLAQFRFNESIAVRIGDHFIIRRPSPAATIGGGTVIDPLAVKHKKKDMESILSSLQMRINLDLKGLILSELDINNYINQKDFLVASHYSQAEISDRARSLAGKNELVLIGQWVIGRVYWQGRIDKIQDLLAEKHAGHPLEIGITQAELQKYLDLPKDIFNQIIAELIESDKIILNRNFVSLSTHKPSLTGEQKMVVSRIMEIFNERRGNPPTKDELCNQIPGGEPIVQFMCRQNMLVEVGDGIIFESKHYQTMLRQIIEVLTSNGSISIQKTRSLFGLSRKYILPLMKNLDKEGITMQNGNERVLAGTYIDSV